MPRTIQRQSDGASAARPTPLQDKDPNVNAATAARKASDDKSKDKPTRAEQRKSASPQQNSKRNNDATLPPSPSDLSSIRLEGEDTETVPIFSTCDDIRRSITSHLAASGQAKAAFTRELSEMLPTSSVVPRQLDAFLKMKGPRAGAHNIAFYASYVFFEKLRVKQDKPKCKKREKMEELWAKEGGLPREGSHNIRLTCFAREKPRMDQYGEIQINGVPNLNGRGIYRKKLGR